MNGSATCDMAIALCSRQAMPNCSMASRSARALMTVASMPM